MNESDSPRLLWRGPAECGQKVCRKEDGTECEGPFGSAKKPVNGERETENPASGFEEAKDWGDPLGNSCL